MTINTKPGRPPRRISVMACAIAAFGGIVGGAMLATAVEGSRQDDDAAAQRASSAAEAANSAASDASAAADSIAAQSDATAARGDSRAPDNEDRVISLTSSAVMCSDPEMLGLARAAWARGIDDPDAKDAFEKSRCLPPLNGPPVEYRLHHQETMPWWAMLDGKPIGGELRVAELRTRFEGQPSIAWIAAEDLPRR